jgi:hypothetical protein
MLCSAVISIVSPVDDAVAVAVRRAELSSLT